MKLLPLNYYPGSAFVLNRRVALISYLSWGAIALITFISIATYNCPMPDLFARANRLHPHIEMISSHGFLRVLIYANEPLGVYRSGVPDIGRVFPFGVVRTGWVYEVQGVTVFTVHVVTVFFGKLVFIVAVFWFVTVFLMVKTKREASTRAKQGLAKTDE